MALSGGGGGTDRADAADAARRQQGRGGGTTPLLVVVAATLPVFHIPAAGLALMIGFDHPLDMGRSATNVLGNYVAACVVDRFEGDEI